MWLAEDMCPRSPSLQLLVDVLRDGGVGADAVALHEANQARLCQARWRLRLALRMCPDERQAHIMRSKGTTTTALTYELGRPWTAISSQLVRADERHAQTG